MEELVGWLLAATLGRFLEVDEDKHWAKQLTAFDQGHEVQARGYAIGDPGSGPSFPKPPEGHLGLSKRQLAVYPFAASPLLLRRTLPLEGFCVDVLRDRTDADPATWTREWQAAECTTQGRPLLLLTDARFLRLLQQTVTAPPGQD
ncbi:hypothetical protein ACIRL2_28550 [Embleya sp. NPDC127516]|uniref:hypothetical protein n=1 Tax=Embleya sp. NPDC127516 TaxID=3363990 RepID=UPI00382FA156